MRQPFLPGSTTLLPLPHPPSASHTTVPQNPLVISPSNLVDLFPPEAKLEVTEKMVGTSSLHPLVLFKRTRRDKACHKVLQQVLLVFMHYRHRPVSPHPLHRAHLHLRKQTHSHRAQASRLTRANACSSQSGSACHPTRIPPITRILTA